MTIADTDIGMRVIGGNVGFTSPAGDAATAGEGAEGGASDRDADDGSLLIPAASAFACASALVGRPRLRLGGGSVGVWPGSGPSVGFGRISRPENEAPVSIGYGRLPPGGIFIGV